MKFDKLQKDFLRKATFIIFNFDIKHRKFIRSIVSLFLNSNQPDDAINVASVTNGVPPTLGLLYLQSQTPGVAAVAEWYRYRIVDCLVTSSSPVPLKTRRVGQRGTLNLPRAETSFRWCVVIVRRGGASSGVVHVTSSMGHGLRYL
ncbi:UNVERIFIED_CONTAM: hypothetical protein NCL1_32043 [Trichonephila clavipes]